MDRGSSWGSVIQGPLVSFGQGPNRSIEGFDCIATIMQNISSLSSHFSHGVISTWNEEPVEKIQIPSEVADKWTIVTSPQPTWDPDNRRKQNLSMQNGIESLLPLGVSHVLKIRTDQGIPEILVEEAQSEESLRNYAKGKMLRSEGLLDEPFYAGDFFMAASSQHWMQYLEAQKILFRVSHPAVVFDGVINFLKKKEGARWRRSTWFIPANVWLAVFPFPRVESYWRGLLERYFFFPSCAAFSQLSWRGVAIDSILDLSVFCFADSLTTRGLNFVSPQMSRVHRSWRMLGWWRTYARRSFRLAGRLLPNFLHSLLSAKKSSLPQGN